MNQEELLIRARDGDREAGEALIQANSGLVWSVARRFFGRGVDPDDLYQLGCLGFLKAVAGFDLSYGTQFSTYAVPKIAGRDPPLSAGRRHHQGQPQPEGTRRPHHAPRVSG